MSYFNISASLTEAQLTQIETSIKQIRTTLGFLINLSPEEKQGLRKMGDKLTSYVQDVLVESKTNSAFIPAGVNLAEFEKDLNLVKSLDRILSNLRPLMDAIEDTSTAAGNEAIKAADMAYGYLKQAAKNNSNLDLTVKVLGARFKYARSIEQEPPAITPAPNVSQQVSLSQANSTEASVTDTTN
jgi:hypothetical protein